MNNAGVIAKTSDIREEVIDKILLINYYGTIELTEKMLPLLPNESKIIIVTSDLGAYKNLKDCSLKRELDNPKLTHEELNKIVDNFCNVAKEKKAITMAGLAPLYGFSKLALNYYSKILAQWRE